MSFVVDVQPTIDTRLSVLEEIKRRALKRGEFTLASGRKSTYYLDLKQVTLSGSTLRGIAKLIWERIAPEEPDAVGGLSIGADPLIAAVIVAADEYAGRDLKGLIVRSMSKDHGEGRKIAGPIDSTYNRLVLLDDVTTTGTSTTIAGDALEAQGHQIQMVVSIVDRREGAGQTFEKRGWHFDSLFTREDLDI